MDHLRIPPKACPECGEVVDAMTKVLGEGKQPQEADIHICLYCGHIQVYHNQEWCEPTDDEHFDIATDPCIKLLQESRVRALKDKS